MTKSLTVPHRQAFRPRENTRLRALPSKRFGVPGCPLGRHYAFDGDMLWHTREDGISEGLVLSLS